MRSSRSIKGRRGASGTSGNSSTGELHPAESLVRLGADQNIDICAIKSRSQQRMYRGVQHIARAKDTNHLAYLNPFETSVVEPLVAISRLSLFRTALQSVN